MHIVLYEPDIPWNTGNVGRTCLATGSALHLVGRLGFSTDAKQVRRSGLDYWDKVRVTEHRDWEAFIAATPKSSPIYFFSKKAKSDFWAASYEPESYLVFGCETKGLPQELFDRYPERFYRIPMEEGAVRSLNLSTAVGIVLYEALRQVRSRFQAAGSTEGASSLEP